MAGSVAVALLRQGGLGTLCKSSLPVLSAVLGPKQNFGQQRTIVSKALREPGYKRPAPYPYKKKPYNLWRAYFDDVTHRFDENSKIVVIDGPPTGNKDRFAKELADELDMLYIPGASLDAVYVNEYGYDLRQLNPQMPFSCRSFDVAQFLQNPNHKLATRMQMQLMAIRFDQYMDAITHLFSTGQGVVMHRSIYSDMVFMETLVDGGYATNNARKYYYECRQQGMMEFLRPHLVIYLDIPVDQVIKNVQERGRPEEKNSPFYTPELLSKLEQNYKKKYLKEISNHTEVLLYDWSEGGEAEVVVEDVCRINFDKHTGRGSKLSDWHFNREFDYKEVRIMFTAYRERMKRWLDVPKLMSIPELVMSGEDMVQYNAVMETAPGCRYSYGFNKDMGDSYYFKWN